MQASEKQQQQQQQPRQTWLTVLMGGCFSLGIVVTLAINGLSLEKIMARPYHTGTDMSEYLAAFSAAAVPGDRPDQWPTVDDYFPSPLLLVLVSRVFGIVYGLIMMIAKGEPFGWQAPFYQYLLLAVSSVAGSACQFEALKFVSFTLQILGKSFKMFPLMCWGVMCASKSHKANDWIVSFFIFGGTIAYMLGGQITPEHNDGNAWWGILLLAGSVAFDSIQSTYQDKVFVQGGNSKYNQMMYMNMFSAVFAGLFPLFRGGWGQTIAFCAGHPLVLMDASIMSLSSVFSQVFIYALLHRVGQTSLIAAVNVRYIVSVVASILLFHHYVTSLQIGALSVCCWALLWQVVGGVREAAGRGEEKPLLGEGKTPEASSKQV